MQIYKFFLKIQNFDSSARLIHRWFYSDGQRTFPLIQPARNVWGSIGIKINNRPHSYTFTKEVGDVSDNLDAVKFYSFLADGPIYRTVPYSILGGNNDLFGNRINEGLATAGGFGPVRTVNKRETLEIDNIAQQGHLLNPGFVNIKVYEENNKVYMRLLGEGTGNFAWLNEKGGTMVFEGLADYGVKEYFNTVKE
ncbi:hypothetical protein M2347_000032 [Chryseobacterium sp. H1D6B]|uniref:hypothetical protein n=1 Tax=Chryseobacterium sp. H1D6B TaxID=2940588 RepID=UPI0015CC08DC|nr:hypothetical protein [Chryseobacterium sp. H1D6B]MDH6250305.1 hypothetical protein [Chryseobacterium sp. H1D6B]